MDQAPSYVEEYTAAIDDTFETADMDDATLEEFFSRPVKTRTYDWGVGTSLSVDFNPWEDFLNNPRVSNRVSNFALFRGNIHVKFMINGNGFYYGRLMASYNPLDFYDEFGFVSLADDQLMKRSQRPHIFLDPTTNQGGQLSLPFFWHANAISLPSQEYERLGRVTIDSFGNLGHISGGLQPITIQVFVWATDVKLSVPTSVDFSGITAQSGKEPRKASNIPKKKKIKQGAAKVAPNSPDEYGQGLISKPASIIARASGMLKDIPFIGPYARATEVASGAIANVAKVFGYSRPNDIATTESRVLYSVGNLANTDLDDTCVKLSIDAKQELTIDPRTFGVSAVDELDVSHLAQIQSWITRFDWQTSYSPGDCIFQSRVTPMLLRDLSLSAGLPAKMLPPMGWVAAPFEHWRGSIEYRFQVISSQFHKGRLLIVYDPYLDQTGGNETNITYNYVVDIGDEKDFSIRVGWGSPYSYLTHTDICDSPQNWSAADGSTLVNPYSTQQIREHNGVLTVYVLNTLTNTDPSIDGNISVNVFARACEDFEVANYNGKQWKKDDKELTWFQAQSGIEFVAQSGVECTSMDDCTDQPSAPVHTMADGVVAKVLDDSDMTNYVYMGESVKSLRQLLKRYTLARKVGLYSPNNVTGSGALVYRKKSFPIFNGQPPDAIYNTTSGGSNNYANMTMLNWMYPCFAAWRGGIRYKWVSNTLDNNRDHTTIVSRLNGQPILSVQDFVDLDTGGPGSGVSSYNMYKYGASCAAGAQVINNMDRAGIEVELPYQTQFRFTPARRDRLWGPDTTDPRLFDTQGVQLYSEFFASGGFWRDHTGYSEFVAGGEDLTFVFFTGVPPIYCYDLADPPAALG